MTAYLNLLFARCNGIIPSNLCSPNRTLNRLRSPNPNYNGGNLNSIVHNGDKEAKLAAEDFALRAKNASTVARLAIEHVHDEHLLLLFFDCSKQQGSQCMCAGYLGAQALGKAGTQRVGAELSGAHALGGCFLPWARQGVSAWALAFQRTCVVPLCGQNCCVVLKSFEIGFHPSNSC